MTAQDEEDMVTAAGVSMYKETFRLQLYTYLCTYTEGAPATTISAVGAKGAFESYRRLADAGRSRRPEHLLKLNVEVLQPGQTTNIKDIENNITLWEHNVHYFHTVAPISSHLSDEQRRLILITMILKDLQDHLTKDSMKYDTYEAVRAEIMEWVHRFTAPKALSGALYGSLNVVEETPHEEDYEAEPEVEEIVLTGDLTQDGILMLNALVRQKGVKVSKGGKGK